MQEQLQNIPNGKNADKLLDSANTASEQLKVLHLAFMAVCAYVLVIVRGTTDLDLLVGTGTKKSASYAGQSNYCWAEDTTVKKQIGADGGYSF